MQELCGQVPRCDADNWNKESKCYMKSSFGLRSVENVVFQPGPCESVFMDTDMYGNDIFIVDNVHYSGKCQDLCIQNSGCFFYTWASNSFTLNTGWVKRCWFKSANSAKTAATGFVSGLPTC